MKLPRRVTVKDRRYYYIQDLEERSPTTGKPKQKWHKLTRVEDGEAALHAALAELLGQDHTEPQGDLPDKIREFQLVHLPSLSPGVRKEYERMYGVVAHSFQRFNVTDVVPGDVIEFLKNFDDHPTARGHYKARISTFFSWCVNKGYVQVNPCREIKLRRPKKRKGRMNGQAFWAIHKELPPVGQCFLELLFLTRQRPTEIRLLQECEIGSTHIRFTPSKTEESSGEEVYVMIAPEIADALGRARKLSKVPGLPGSAAYLIQTTGGTAYTKNGLYSMWARACRAAGIHGVTTRDVRPFALHAMEQAGYDLKEIQLSAAHTTRDMTEGYLEQHRERISNASIPLPEKEKT